MLRRKRGYGDRKRHVSHCRYPDISMDGKRKTERTKEVDQLRMNEKPRPKFTDKESLGRGSLGEICRSIEKYKRRFRVGSQTLVCKRTD